MAKKQRFRVTLEPHEGTRAALVTLPFDVSEAFGSRGRVPVKGTVNGFPFRSSVFPRGARGGGVHYMVVNREMREGAKVNVGDTVEFVMERDDEPRIMKAPPDLARALKASPAAKARWEKLPYTHRKEYVQAIEEAKKPETRARRIAKAVEQLAAEAGKKAGKTAKPDPIRRSTSSRGEEK